MQFSLQGKTALVTGASRGIGRAIAQRLAADGALVAIHYGGNDAAASETLKAIERAGGQGFLVKAELGVNEDTAALFSKLEKELAGRPLDILVNNAAIAPQIAIHQTTPEEFDRIFAINVRAPFFIIQRALPLMPDGGRIINISSGVTWFATPATVYSMTKGALNVLGRSLANSLGSRNITVNTISPGITDTDMNPSIRDKDAEGGAGHEHDSARSSRTSGRHRRRSCLLRLRRCALDYRPDFGSQRWPIPRTAGTIVCTRQ
jgi:3-oxoacyl-[acyl-carrier protein] reductase